MSLVALQWTVTGLSLAGSVLLVLSGRLADRFGRRRSLVIGGLVYAGGVAVAAGAESGPVLIAGCACAGAGAAFLFPAGLATIRTVFADRGVDLALGIWIAAWSFFFALGPIAGGLLAEHFSWRAFFWLQLPCVLASVAAFVLITPESDGEDRHGLPYRGLSALTGGLVALCLGLGQSAVWGWGSPATIALLGAGAALLIGFKPVDSRSTVRVVEPVLWRDGRFVDGTLMLILFNVAFLPLVVFVPQYLQLALGYSPLDAGLLMLPSMVPFVLLPLATGALGERVDGRWLFLAGGLLIAAACLLLARVDASSDYVDLVPALILSGAGSGLLVESTVAVAVADVPPGISGAASGLTLVGSFLGGSIGIALTTGLLSADQNRAVDQLAARGDEFAIAFGDSMVVPLGGAALAVVLAVALLALLPSRAAAASCG